MGRRGAGQPKHLIVFAREPRVGRVKKRLAATIGDVAAGFWYRRQLADLLRRLSGPDLWHRHLHVTPATARAAALWPRGWRVEIQRGPDLGARMRHALAAPATGPAVLIGSDVPDAGPQHVRAAFRALERADVVLGPAADGGYWLIGMRRRRAPPPFGPVRWSTAHALQDTMDGLPRGTSVCLLDDVLADVDRAADLATAVRTPPRGHRAPAGGA